MSLVQVKVLRSLLRGRTVRAERLIESLKPFLLELEELLGALGPHLSDPDWTEAAKKLDEMIAIVKRPSAFYRRVRARELALERWPPRKGQRSVRRIG